ncbi:hypothetical protein Gohar_027231 [Gossypium harknessii]|uniref:Uncharacterized protein n=1 Tax=Gossypium harknessii TaxID=34285 RepID=A0A7J9HU58_9ROSI|nr:hypothetical protein [Gossypium harknessii]
MIADMEIDDFPSHIIEKKSKNTWETWNSPRLSLDSLHLDEIEEMNLDSRRIKPKKKATWKNDIQERNLRKQILKYGQKEAT